MTGKVVVSGDMFSVINFAMQQNYVPIFRKLTLMNNSDGTLSDLVLRISFEPAFAKEYKLKIMSLEPEVPVEISPINIVLSPDYLVGLTEKVVGNVYIELLENDECIYAHNENITLLAYDQWPGVSIMPEIVCSFITPNHSKVAEIIAKAKVYLDKWTKSPSFTGYQTENPNTVRRQMAAIYAALQETGITYIMPPASFENVGQRVRLPHTVLEQKMGTCIDLSVLYAACLEAVGLHPILFLTPGHAFCGCWLIKDSFPECIQDDAAAIRKRFAEEINEICPVECTSFVVGKSYTFEEAVKLGKRNFSDPIKFDFAIDVKRCRSSGIQPLPIRNAEDSFAAEADLSRVPVITPAPKDLVSSNSSEGLTEKMVTKQEVWQRRLLDLSLRNRLLSFRETKSVIPLMVDNLGKLEDALYEGDQFRICARPKDWENTPRDSRLYEMVNKGSAVEQLIQEEFEYKRIRSILPEVELMARGKNLHRHAKESLEENGSNTLFLALGFLRWFETDLSETERLAPLVLVPVELVRKAQGREFELRSRDEEPQMNITLLEKLKQDFGIIINGLDPLPVDEKGVDLKLVFNNVRRAVMDKKRWDVIEQAFISIFSFNQYVMWNDIRSRVDELHENKIVRSLISGQMEWHPDQQLPSSKEMDTLLAPAEMAVPTSADSTQLAAIYSAAAGQSFVLHGPPGTGKSQTITNIIANALYQGKSVLFVAEKIAALTVVQDRLKKIGLSPFSLELHSNKARKKDVLEQLDKTLSFGRVKPPEAYRSKAEHLHTLRSELNDFISEIHSKRAYGFSLHEAITKYEENASLKGTLSFHNEVIEAMDEDSIATWRDILIRMKVALTSCNNSVVNHPLRFFRGRNYSITDRSAIQDYLSTFIELIAEFKALCDQVCSLLSIDPRLSYGEVATVVALCDAIDNAPQVPRAMFEEYDLIIADAGIRELIQNVVRQAELWDRIASIMDPMVLDYPAQEALLRLRKADSSWFLLRFLGKNKLKRELQLYGLKPRSVTMANLASLIADLVECRQLRDNIEKADQKICRLFGHNWRGLDSDGAQLLEIYESALELHTLIKSLAQDHATRMSISSSVAEVVSDSVGKDASIASMRPLMEQLSATMDTGHQEYLIDFEGTYEEGQWLAFMQAQLSVWKDNLDDLRLWAGVLKLADELEAAKLGNIVEAIMSGDVSPEELIPAYECNIFLACAHSTIEKSDKLRTFQGVQFEETIRRYRAVVAEFQELTINELVAKLSANIPQTSADYAHSSEISILQRAIRSRGRGMPIRKLFDSIPNLLRRICPCMLMSPISVAQYIDPKFPKFDLVVFDEASQIPTCDAVGAIARGHDVIVVGDPKQLPPTTFFKGDYYDEENYELEDLESLLDDCLALSMPQKYLLWHYRSKHESLIAFSNSEYYENKLYTFPSPDSLVSEVKLVPVDGFYERSGSRQNRGEAEAIVAEIIRRLKDPQLRQRSIGVVTFSRQQQNLVDDLLMEAFRKHPELEEQNDNAREQIFIKNLENVQGDERDIILFSVGYGPDKNGKVTMNFGPLNREGGSRRLNVAITRARYSMIVYSTLKPEQIDLSRTNAEGVASLKGFLEFAAIGKNNVKLSNQQDKESKDGKFQKILARKLQERGYEARPNVGFSAFKVDVAVVHPNQPDRYILGILGDGDSYCLAPTARERNILHPEVLSSLGWHLYRVWIMDWLDNPGRELDRIEEAINKALEKEKTEGKRQHVSMSPKTLLQKSNLLEVAPALEGKELHFEKLEAEGTDSNKKTYVCVTSLNQFPAESFYQQQVKPLIMKHIERLISTEAPISRALLTKRILGTWSMTRAGTRVTGILGNIIKQMSLKWSQSSGTIFYWRRDQVPSEYAEYRIPGNDEDKRSMNDIPAEEIANAIKAILDKQLSMSRADLVRETARIFGFSRTGKIVLTAVNYGIKEAIKRGYITVTEDGDRVSAMMA